MEHNLLVVNLKCSPFKLQRLYLPSTIFPLESGKHAVVELNDSSSFICRVFHDDLLQRDCCLLEKSVQCSLSTSVSNGDVEVSTINFIPYVKPIKSIKVTVVLTKVEDSSKWNDQKHSYAALLKQLLQLFVINTGATVNLKDFQAAQKLGVYTLYIKDIGIPQTGRVVASTKVVVHEVTSWERYSLRLEKEDIQIAGNKQAYDQLKKYVLCRSLLRANKLARDFDFSQLMVIGPGGSGKKTVIRKVAQESNAVLIPFDCTRLMRPKPGDTEALIAEIFERAKLLAVEGLVILLLLQLEAVCARPGRILSQINNVLDSVRRLSTLIVVTTSADPNEIHESVKSASRFHDVIFVGVPSESDRLDMLELLSGVDLRLPRDRWCEFAQMTPGYVMADLALVITKTRRSLHYEGHIKPSEEQILSHIKQALASVEPSAVRGEMGLVRSNSSILEIGGLRRIKDVLLQSVQWPLFHAAAFKRLNIKHSSGILLYGPPGCAKTSLARAVAAGSNVTFLAVSAADLYSPFVGDTERIIASLFQRARAAAPTLLFIDEIDALVGNRQGQQKRAQERVLSSFLIELDGVGVNAESEFLRDPSEVRVILVAATNRPHVIDNALLRPGRLDKLIHVPPPDLEDRLDILQVITKKMPLDDNVDLFDIAEKTELFSGADLANLCREAALLAMTVNGVDTTKVSQEDFLGALSVSTPSLTVSQVEWYKSFSFS